MADNSGLSSSASGVDKNAIFHEVSPYIIITLRFFNVMVLLMAIISVVLCIVKGEDNKGNYLLVVNIAISGLVTIVVNWWYRGGDLSSDKYWFIFMLGAIVLLQCITTDIYAFHTPEHTGISTPITRRTTPFKPISWATLNTSTLLPPTTHRSVEEDRNYLVWT